MTRFYTDEGFPRPTALAFRNLGYDVLTCQEAGKANQFQHLSLFGSQRSSPQISEVK